MKQEKGHSNLSDLLSSHEIFLNGKIIPSDRLLKHEIIDRLNTPPEGSHGIFMTWAPYDRTSSINKTFIKKETEFFEFVQKNIPDFLKLFFPNIKTTMIGLSPELFINYFCNNTDRKFRRYFKEGYSESIKLIDFCSTLKDDFLKESEKKFNKKFDNLSFDFFDHLFDLCIIDFSGRVYENPDLANTLGIKRRGSIINLLFKEWYD